MSRPDAWLILLGWRDSLVDAAIRAGDAPGSCPSCGAPDMAEVCGVCRHHQLPEVPALWDYRMSPEQIQELATAFSPVVDAKTLI
jgi:hypothetical protein